MLKWNVRIPKTTTTKLQFPITASQLYSDYKHDIFMYVKIYCNHIGMCHIVYNHSTVHKPGTITELGKVSAAPPAQKSLLWWRHTEYEYRNLFSKKTTGFYTDDEQCHSASISEVFYIFRDRWSELVADNLHDTWNWKHHGAMSVHFQENCAS